MIDATNLTKTYGERTNLLKSLAAEGRTVFVSSHLMSEMALMASHLIVIGQGRLIADTTVEELTSGGSGGSVLVRTARLDELRDHLDGPDIQGTDAGPDSLVVQGLSSDAIGRIAADRGIALSELTPRQATLEEVFMQITQDSVEYDHHEGATR